MNSMDKIFGKTLIQPIVIWQIFIEPFNLDIKTEEILGFETLNDLH